MRIRKTGVGAGVSTSCCSGKQSFQALKLLPRRKRRASRAPEQRLHLIVRNVAFHYSFTSSHYDTYPHLRNAADARTEAEGNAVDIQVVHMKPLRSEGALFSSKSVCSRTWAILVLLRTIEGIPMEMNHFNTPRNTARADSRAFQNIPLFCVLSIQCWLSQANNAVTMARIPIYPRAGSFLCLPNQNSQ